MATLVSVNVGMPQDVSWRGRTVHTGIWKRPVSGPTMVRRLNIEGDGQGDPIRIGLPKGTYIPEIAFRRAGETTRQQEGQDVSATVPSVTPALTSR